MRELKLLKKRLLKEWGTPCKDFSILCPLCLLWRAFETLEELNDFGPFKKGEKKQ